MCVALFMLLLDVTIVAVALPDIQHSLDASLHDLQWIVDAYTLPLAALLLTAAVIGDRIGRKRLFLAGMMIFTGASLGCALSDDVWVLNTMRAFQGLGAALLFGVSLPLISAAYPDAKARARAIGAFGATMGLAIASGPLIGGLLISGAGWEWIFFVNIPLGALALLLGWWAIEESRDARTRTIDWGGTVLATIALLLGVLAVIEGNGRGWTSAYIVALLLGSALSLAAFVLYERRSPHPMVDLSLLVHPRFAGLCVAGFIAFGTITASANFVSLFFMNTLGLSAFETGLRLLPLSATAFLVAPLTALLRHKAPVVVWLSGALAAIAVGSYLSVGVSATDTWQHYLPGFVLAGIGLGIIIPVTSQDALTMVRAADAGMATGMVSAARQLGTVIGVAVLGSLFSETISSRAATDIGELSTAAPSGTYPSQQILESFAAALGSGAGLRVTENIGGDSTDLVPILSRIARDASGAGVNSIFAACSIAAAVGTGIIAVLWGMGKRHRLWMGIRTPYTGPRRRAASWYPNSLESAEFRQKSTRALAGPFYPPAA
ncbi:MFS transporter [Rhodococcus qingshengii]|uniref:MFS transporter n=1 Tax=Rhodococcus qingshengii TaxID=334542 RepID=UPI0036544680